MIKPRPGKRNGYKPPEDICTECGNKGRIFKKLGKKKFCRKCYRTPRHRCVICQKIKVINKNDPQIGPICLDCYKRPLAICSKCGQEREIVVRTNKNELICKKCYKPPLKECAYCFREKPLALKNPPTCHTCYARIYRYKTLKAKPRRK